MKKVLLVLSLVLVLFGCASKPQTTDPKVLNVSCTLDPHSTVLEFVKPILKEKYNIELKIQVLDDYYIFNKALDAGDVDANYFQHVPFFNKEVKENNYKITNVAGVHIEPFGFYSKKVKSVTDIPNQAVVIVSNSVADHGRILKILESYGVIKLKEGVNALDVTLEDIIDNPKNLTFKEIKPELLITAFNNNEGDLVAINGNYALQGGLSPAKDAVMVEKATSDNPYVNIVAVKAGTENDEKIKALIEVMTSKEVKEFIKSKWSDGSVIPTE